MKTQLELDKLGLAVVTVRVETLDRLAVVVLALVVLKVVALELGNSDLWSLQEKFVALTELILDKLAVVELKVGALELVKSGWLLQYYLEYLMGLQ